MYLFPQWFHEHCNIKSRSLHSPEISSLCERTGVNQVAIRDFFTRWINKTGTDSDIYYDITSISSYSDNIDFIEWGYNRDHENLPQTNLGIACNKNSTPLFYQLYPGSITDVTTLKNNLNLLEYYDFSNTVLILDRGFCSRLNIMGMNLLRDRIRFIQPMTYSMKKVVEMLKNNRKKLRQTETAFKYNEEILHYIEDSLDIEGVKYRAHLFYNEKAEADLRNNFMHKVLSIKEKVLNKKFEKMKDYMEFRSSNIPEKYLGYFKLNRNTHRIELNHRNIKSYLIKSGYFVLLSNSEKTKKECLLEHYRNRDTVEKLFDVEKNELDGNRLRVHRQYNADGRIFIKFIALIIYSKISFIMKEKKLFEKFTLKEMLAELSKIRCSDFDGKFIVSEISKTQKNILKAFDIRPENLEKHRY